MKTSLLLSRLSVAIFLLSFTLNSSGQTVIFSEDFSGFTTGSHTSPSTSDISGSLDSRTHQPGWSGYKVYSAAGEIKTGTSTVPGWIETPSIEDEFKTIIMAIGQGITSGKIRFESQAKRYFLDNVIIEAGEVTAVQHIKTDHHLQISVFPNPSADIITVNNIGSFSRLDIISISGEICKVVVLSREDKIEITTEGLRPGVYFVKVSGIAGSVTKKFIKYR